MVYTSGAAKNRLGSQRFASNFNTAGIQRLRLNLDKSVRGCRACEIRPARLAQKDELTFSKRHSLGHPNAPYLF
ncbi:hypothetical protein [Rhizobium cremeum]|uniref:hypothetical protein n=1 Tax=Rhizobium cremeum TaxID=2813827 RepID=UPI0013B0472B